MRRHVVRTLVVVGVGLRILGRDPREIAFEVAARRRRGILLDQQRRRRVPAEQGEQAFAHMLRIDPVRDLPGDLGQALAPGMEFDRAARLPHGASA